MLPKAPLHARLTTSLCWVQGAYYFATGVWPLVSIRTFKLVTGEKTDNLPSGLETDHWLVMTVSVLIVAISLTLLVAAFRQTRALELAILGISSALGLTTIDIVYTARGVILPIYLLDAVLEIPLIVAWCAILSWRLRLEAPGRE